MKRSRKCNHPAPRKELGGRDCINANGEEEEEEEEEKEEEEEGEEKDDVTGNVAPVGLSASSFQSTLNPFHDETLVSF